MKYCVPLFFPLFSLIFCPLIFYCVPLFLLQQAVLKRGLPKRLVVDNGAAYRAQTLQAVCARLGIHLIHCRPYAPEGKGKLERWHRTLRDQFLSEIDFSQGVTLEDANARLWAWIEAIYHRQPHGGLGP
ncbi:MAG: DDE-type integrase/transposase/recombinase, partial [Gammaproteobacteria bacterium]|nr:DDE-type integrase/transposase/recombinase [Gammaproteobacteria bacterium]MBU1962456.1 DDE-type integrase/transposase/recombinase [Gammaproteobacteria bacterium]